ncbi:hypothetical protein [Parasphingorhabdus sp.]|uniref:hypothetical protein n=1 Tax=Parasphingorhabdus sp. TaxID=2709688 RepID=UPI003A8F351F
MINFSMFRLLKPAIAASALLSVGGCMYGGAGYYGDGYVNNRGYDCDPYAPFDDYYACDYGYGFADIGFSGGWYDQYYYPGYGIYIFDRGGRRHAMHDYHRRHWARQRAEFGGHHVRERDRIPERRAVPRDQRYERGDRARDPRRRNYRDNPRARPGTRDRQDSRPASRAPRRDRTDQAAPVRNRSDRPRRADRRPPIATEQPQAQPPSANQPDNASRPPRAEGPRYSPRTNRSARERVSDD